MGMAFFSTTIGFVQCCTKRKPVVSTSIPLAEHTLHGNAFLREGEWVVLRSVRLNRLSCWLWSRISKQDDIAQVATNVFHYFICGIDQCWASPSPLKALFLQCLLADKHNNQHLSCVNIVGRALSAWPHTYEPPMLASFWHCY